MIKSFWKWPATAVPALLSRDKLVLKLGRRPVIASRFAIITPERFKSPAALAPMRGNKN
jgi:hypothetical protein